MTSLNNSVNRYYRQIRGWLPCSRKLKDQILARIHESVDNYLADNPQADFDALQSHFGTPQAIAAAYVDEMATDTLLRDLRIRRRIVSIVAGTMAIVLALWVGVVSWAIVREISRSNGHIIEEGVGYLEQTTP